MATIKQLEEQVTNLSERVGRLQTSNSNLKDEIHVLKHNYSVLVKEMSRRLEAIHGRFRNT